MATVSVVALTIYFLIALPGVKNLWLSFIARSRRERVALLTDEVFDRVGGFMLGNLLTSVISAVGTYLWLIIFGVPYALLLALVVAVFDLIPMVGSTIAGIIVSLVALTKGLPVGIATAALLHHLPVPRGLSLEPEGHETHGEGIPRSHHHRHVDRRIAARDHRGPDCHSHRSHDPPPVGGSGLPQAEPAVSDLTGPQWARSRQECLFDVDGTLVDTNYLHTLAWSRALMRPVSGLP